MYSILSLRKNQNALRRFAQAIYPTALNDRVSREI